MAPDELGNDPGILRRMRRAVDERPIPPPGLESSGKIASFADRELWGRSTFLGASPQPFKAVSIVGNMACGPHGSTAMPVDGGLDPHDMHSDPIYGPFHERARPP